jgi:hypothetical protein
MPVILAYSGDRDQEDRSSKPAWANSSGDLVFKIPTTKIGLEKWLKVKARSSSPRTSKKKKNVPISEWVGGAQFCNLVNIELNKDTVQLND